MSLICLNQESSVNFLKLRIVNRLKSIFTYTHLTGAGPVQLYIKNYIIDSIKVNSEGVTLWILNPETGQANLDLRFLISLKKER